MTCILLMPILILGAEPSAADRFSDVRIEKPFDRYLLASVVLMENTGTKVIKLPKERSMVVAVASTVLNDSSARERLRAEKVCRVKAIAYLLQEQKGVRVFHSEESTDKTVIVNEDGKEHGRSFSQFLEITKTKVQGIAKDMPVVGHWKSKEGDVFYLALGGIVNEKGDLIQDGDSE